MACKPTAADNKPGQGDDTPLPLDKLDTFNASGTAEIGKLKLKNLNLSNVQLKLAAAKGAPKTVDLNAALYGGSLASNTRVTPGARPGLAESLKLAGINAGPLLIDFMGKDYVTGTGNFGLDITGAASWLDAHYTSYDNGSGYDETTGLAFGPTNGDGRNFSGNRIVRTPVFTSTLGLNQGFKLFRGRFNIAAEWYHNSGYYYLAQNSPVSYEPRYNLINAHVSYLYSPWGTRLTVFGQNLNNKRYDLAQFHTDFGREDTLAPPLTVGVKIDIDL